MRNTFVFIFLILISFGLGFSINKDALVKSLEGEKEIPKQEEVVVEEKIAKEYKSPFGFSFNYDDAMELENSAIVIPVGYRVSSVATVRYVKEQNCGASGLAEHCKAFIENPAIAFGVVESSFEDLKKNQLKDYIDMSEPITLSEKTGIQYYAGIEGEGVVTIVLPLKENQTLLIQYTFDELYDSTKTNSDIYGSEKQKAVVDSILSTLKFK